MYIVKDKGVIVVDTGCFTEKEKYLEAFSEAGVAPTDVKLLAVTHGHTDHFDGISSLKEITGAPVVCHALAAAALMSGVCPALIPRGERGKEFLKLIDGEFPAASPPLTPDMTFDAEFDLTPYGIAGKILHTPGHSFCSSSVILDTGEAFVGDMATESPITQRPSLALLAADEMQLFESYRKILSSANSIYVGHGQPLTRKEFLNVFMDDGSEEAIQVAKEFGG